MDNGRIKLNYMRTIFAGFGFLSVMMFWQVYDAIVPLILKNTFALGETVIGAIMAIDNVSAIVLLPIAGVLSDRLATRWGRRIPVMIPGTILGGACLFGMALFDSLGSFAGFMIALAVGVIAMGTYRVCTVSLMPDITPKPFRSQANGIINLMGGIGGIIMLFAIQQLAPEGENLNYMPLFTFGAVGMVLFVVACAVLVNEPKAVLRMREESIKLGIQEEEQPPRDGRAGRALSGMDPAVRKSFLFMLATIFFFIAAFNGFSTFASLYFTTMFGISLAQFANIMILLQLIAIIAYLPVGCWQAGWAGKRR